MDKTKQTLAAGEIADDKMTGPQDRESGTGILAFSDRERTLDIEREIQILEKEIEFFKKIQNVSLKLTKPSDWILQRREGEDQPTPYPMERGLENIRIAWGIDVSGLAMTQEWAEDKDGRYYTYVATGRAYSKRLGSYIEDIGVCSQRDKFFGRISGGWKEIQDVDMANIRRKAVTNLYSRLIRRMTGLMNVTLEDLLAAGFDQKSLPMVEYKSGAGKAKAAMGPEGDELAKKINEIAFILGQGNAELAGDAIKQSSQFEGKKGLIFARTAQDIRTVPWLKTTYGRIKEMLLAVFPEEFKARYADEFKAIEEKAKGKK